MGNIGSHSGQLKYRPGSSDNLLWPQSLPRTEISLPKNHLKVLPDKTQNIRLRHTENGEILQTGGTLTGRQIRSDLGETREIKKSESEPHLHILMNSRQREKIESSNDKKLKKKYRAPPPPRIEFNQISPDSLDFKKEIDQKARLFKTKIQSDRRSALDFHQNSDYFKFHKNLESRNIDDKENVSCNSSHRFSWPSLNNASLDFQGELKEATSRLRRIRSEESDRIGSSEEDIFGAISRLEKLKTLDHQIGKEDLIKLRARGFESINTKNILYHNNISSEKQSKINYSNKNESNNKKETPKQFYFGMQSIHKTNSTEDNNLKNYDSSESSSEIKQDDYDSDIDVHPSEFLLLKKSHEINRFSSVPKWKHSPYTETSETYKKNQGLGERREDPSRVFSIFPTGSISNDRSRSGDSGISGDGSPGLYVDILNPTDEFKSIIHGWTPEQDLGDDSSYEEESSTTVEFTETTEDQPNQGHVFSLSLPRDYHLTSSASDQNETNFEKIKRSISGILNTINKKEVDGSIENEKSNWSLNKSLKIQNADIIAPKLESESSSPLDELLLKNSKFNTGRVMYLPNFETPTRQRRYASRYKQKRKEDKFGEVDNIDNEEKQPMQKSLQDSPIMNGRKSIRKKPKRFTFQSTIRQIEKRRIAERLSREAEKKEQQRLRELELMQNVEEEFQRKRAREKNNIKQQLSRYTSEDNRYDSQVDSKLNGINSMKDMLQARSEPDGAVSSSPTSSLVQPDDRWRQWKKNHQNNIDLINNNKDLSRSDICDDKITKARIQTQVLSEYRQPQREYKDYTSTKKYISEGANNNRQLTTTHPKVTYKMLKTKGMSRYASNNHRKDFSMGLTDRTEATWNQQFVKTKSLPNKYYSQYGQLTRF